MTYQRKTRDVWILESNYGDGWGAELEETTWRDMRQTLKEYRDNCPQYQFRAKLGRERIEATK